MIEQISTPDLSRVEPKFEHPQSTFIHEIREKMKDNLDDFKERQTTKTKENILSIQKQEPKAKLSIRETLSSLNPSHKRATKQPTSKSLAKESTPDTAPLKYSPESPTSISTVITPKNRRASIRGH